MQHELEVILRPGEGALMRLLSMVERRGFPILGTHAEMAADNAQIKVRLRLADQGRSVDNLCQQVRKQVDVTSLLLLDPREASS